MSSEVERATWKALAEGVPPGPWQMRENHGRDMCDEAWSCVRVIAADNTLVAEATGDYLTPEDECEDPQAVCEFIAAARTAVPALLADVERLEAEVQIWRDKRPSVGDLVLELVALRARFELLEAENRRLREADL